MEAIPRVFSVTVQIPSNKQSSLAGWKERLGETILSDLVRLPRQRFVESKGNVSSIKLLVCARDPETAAARSQRAIQFVTGSGLVLEVESQPKKLPYRRSLVFGRYHRSRFNVQGGEGGNEHQHAPLPAGVNPTQLAAPTTGTFESLVNEALMSEATAMQRKQRQVRRTKWRLANPMLARKMAVTAKRTKAKRVAGLRRNKNKIAMNRKRFANKFDPNYESTEQTDTPMNLTEALKDYPKALAVHNQLKDRPSEWFRGGLPRSLVAEAISAVQNSEGIAPANLLSEAYIDNMRGHRTPVAEEVKVLAEDKRTMFPVKLQFESYIDRDRFAKAVCRYNDLCESVSTADDFVTVNVRASNLAEAKQIVVAANQRIRVPCNWA